jgi:hypothetical protein
MTATHRPRPGRMMTGPHRMIHALRYANDELMRAGEAIIRSARAPRPAPQPSQPQPGTGRPGRNGLTGPHDEPRHPVQAVRAGRPQSGLSRTALEDISPAVSRALNLLPF